MNNHSNTNQLTACPAPANGESDIAKTLGGPDRIFLFGQAFLLRVMGVDPVLGQAAISAFISMVPDCWDHILSAVGAK